MENVALGVQYPGKIRPWGHRPWENRNVGVGEHRATPEK